MSKCNFSKDAKLALLKGYLHYKTIISVSCGTHAKYFFYFLEKFLFQDIQVYVFLAIPWLTKSVMPWWVLVNETGCIFEYIFWTTSH